MKRKLDIELQENLIRFVLSSHKKNKLEILQILETGYELESEKSQVEETDGELYKDKVEEPRDVLGRAVAKIEEVVKQNKWEKATKTLLYNIGDLTHMVLELPLVTEDEMNEAVRRKLASEKLLKEEDEVAIETIGAKDSKGLYGVYVQVIPKMVLDKLQPLKLQGIDFEVFAINRKQVSYTNPKENTIFMSVEEKQSIITIYHRERLALYRKISIGKQDIVEEIEKILGVSREKAEILHEKYGYVDTVRGIHLLDAGERRGMELSEAYENILGKVERKVFQYIDYFQFRHSGENIKTMYYKGVKTKVEEIESYLKKTFYLENVFEYNHLLGVDAEKVGGGIENSWYTLLGTVESKHGAKFIGKSLKLPFKVRKNPIYIAIAIIFIMFMGMRYGYYKLQELDQMKRLDAIEAKQEMIADDLKEYNAVQKKIVELKRDISYLSEITGKNTIFNNFLSDLSYEVDSQIYLDDVSYRGNRVTLRGRAISGTEYAEVYINKMVRNIEKISKEVRLVRTTKLSKNKNVNDFLIEVTLSGGEIGGK